METVELLNEIVGTTGRWQQTGSTVICSPPPTDTDVDYVCVVKGEDALSEAVAELSNAGFKADMGDHYQDLMAYGFISWKRERDNIILTKNADFYDRHCLATKVCKRLNLLEKAARIVVFQAILYSKFEEAAQ